MLKHPEIFETSFLTFFDFLDKFRRPGRVAKIFALRAAFFARSFNEVGKTGKEERKSKNENTRLGR